MDGIMEKKDWKNPRSRKRTEEREHHEFRMNLMNFANRETMMF